jgi:hypothetical protein
MTIKNKILFWFLLPTILVAIARNDSRREYYIKTLNTHLAIATNKKPLDPDILELFVVDLDGMVISSTDVGLLDRDVSDKTYFSKTLKEGSCIDYLHYSPEIRNIAFFYVSRLLFRKGGQSTIGIIVNRYKGENLMRTIR